MIRFAIDQQFVALIYAVCGLAVASLAFYIWTSARVPRWVRAVVLLLCATLSTGAIIQSGVSADLWTIGATSKAGRVSMYDDAGNSLVPAELARGSVAIVVRQSATTAAGACTWGLRNSGSTRTIQILSATVQYSFDGTGAATELRYEFIKGTGVTVFSGGSVVTPSIYKTSLTQATHVDARVLDTGLTTTGLSAGASINVSGWSRLTHSATQAGLFSPVAFFDFSELGMGPLELAQNEIFCLRQLTTSVIGDTVLGNVAFIEK